ASGFDPVIPGSNPGAPAKSHFSQNFRRHCLPNGMRWRLFLPINQRVAGRWRTSSNTYWKSGDGATHMVL
ncbi:MAG: hypothetical protein ACO23H_19490, partial [Alphaproteobacteria bacterium]